MASAAFDDSSWSHYSEITADNTKVSEAVGDIAYDLSQLDSTWWENVQKADGGDIRVTNAAGDTAYSFELENFSDNGSSGTGYVFFDSQDLQTGSDTTWRIYIGNSSASLPAEGDTLGAENVWGSDYTSVYHLAENSGNAIDSTGNSDGTFNGDLPTQVSGQIGNAQDGDGNGDDINTNQIALTTGSNFSVMAWINPDADDGYPFGHRDQSTNDLIFQLDPISGTGWQLRHGDLNNNEHQITFGSYSQGSWTNITITFNSSTPETICYQDGSQQGTDTTSISDNSGTTSNLEIFDRNTGNQFDGQIDEFRVLSVEVSSNWQSTHYNNQNDQSTFWTTGATQTVGGVTGRKRIIIA